MQRRITATRRPARGARPDHGADAGPVAPAAAEARRVVAAAEHFLREAAPHAPDGAGS